MVDGIIIPLFKKGNSYDVGSYRGITLQSCLSKLFTSILNHRISDYCDKYSTLSDAQFGFKKGRSTTDAICSLFSIVYMFACIDMKKCFDSIYRNALWF